MNQKSSEISHWGGASRLKLAFIALAVALLASLAIFATSNLVANADDASAQGGEADAEVSTSTTLREEMYRIYNPWTGEHLYTSNVTERDDNVKLGWRDEGIEWIAPKQTKTTSYKKVYRLYNPYVAGGDHHYTTNEEEYNSLPAAGWKQEGVAWYSAGEKESGAVKLLRQYNPFAETGTHNYTKNEKEQENLVSLGWRAEGVGWYGYDSLYVSVANLTAKVSTVGTTYTGKQLTPAITISGLTAGTDFTVSYGTNINAGENAGTATIKGKGAYNGTLTVKFDILKADPTVTAPTNLTGVQSKPLNSVKIPAATNGTFAWKTPTATMAKQGTQTFDATFTPKDTNNYNTITTKVPVYVKGLYTVSFETGQGSKVESQKVVEGEKAQEPTPAPTLDNYGCAGWYTDAQCSEDNEFDFGNDTITKDTKLYAKWKPVVKFDTQGHGSEIKERIAEVDNKLSDPSAEAGSVAGLVIEGWYKDAKCSVDKEWSFDDDEVSEPTTLYANWKPADDGDMQAYWIAPSSTCTTASDGSVNVKVNENYVKEAWNVKKSSDEITSDVQTLVTGSSAENYEAVKKEYEGFMNNDDFHLFTKLADSASTDDEAGTDSTGKNGFAEFRIIQVGGHLNVEGDDTSNDLSALTFMATHVLPQAQAINDSPTTSGGWTNMSLSGSMKEGGEVFNSFNSNFTDDIQEVDKRFSDGSGNYETEKSKLWLLSYSEILGTVENYPSEGVQYDWIKATKEKPSASDAFILTTRAGHSPKGITNDSDDDDKTSSWWLRTPTTSTEFACVLYSGLVGSEYKPTNHKGIVPCFTFGGNSVKFDNQGHGNSIATQIFNSDSELATDPSDKLGTVEGLRIDGWYTDAKCSEENKWDFSKEKVTQPMTLYANWVPADDGDALKYWIAPAKACTTGNTAEGTDVNVSNDNYVKANWNVKKSSKEIQADMARIQKGETAVINEYKAFMTNDDYHLYTAWNGSSQDGVEDSKENKFVEFRIIQVGSNGNNEAVTFQATHTLPTAYQMEAPDSMGLYWVNGSDWFEKSLRNDLNLESGEIYSNFSSSFVSDLQAITKTSHTTKNDSTSTDKMWIASRFEMSGSSAARSYTFDGTTTTITDGSPQYAYYTTKSIGDSKNFETAEANPALVRKTRAGNYPNGITSDTSEPDSNKYSWWTRSLTEWWTGSSAYWNKNHPKTKLNAVTVTGQLVNSVHEKYCKGIVPCFSFGGYAVTFDTQGHGSAVDGQAVNSGSLAKDPTSQTSAAGLALEGWYTDAKCTPANKWKFETNTVTKATTLYANWVPSEETEGDYNKFWMSPSEKITATSAAATTNANYVEEKWNVKKSSADLLSDVAKIKAGDTATIAEYTNYMNSDAFHLYTRWNGGRGSDVQSKNGFAEFRIIGVGQHDGDGSALTFQAVHALPIGFRVSNTEATTVSWGDTELYKSMQDGDGGSAIFANFQPAFTEKIYKVKKKTTEGNGTPTVPVWQNVAESDNIFWLASRSEISGASIDVRYKSEGSQYAYYANKSIGDDTTSANACLAKLTRAGKEPTVDSSKTQATGCWWMRSPNVEAGASYLAVSSTGCLNTAGLNAGTTYAGVVPCFCF